MLVASQLIDARDLVSHYHGFAVGCPESIDAESFSGYLVEQRLLTSWQCKKLLNGQYKGFYLDNYLILDHPDAAESRYTAKDCQSSSCVTLLLKPWSPSVGRIEYTVLPADED
jgi:hypothetical protein